MASILGTPSGASGSTTSPTVPAGSGRIGLFALTGECSTLPTSVTATLGAIALTSLGSASGTDGSTFGYSYVFYATDATLTTIGTGSKSLVFTIVGGSGGQGNSSEATFVQSASQSAPTFASNGGNGTGATVNITVSAASAVSAAFISNNNVGTAVTSSTGDTIDYDAADGGGDCRSTSAHRSNPSTGTETMTFSTTSRWSIGGVVVEDAGGGGGGSVLLLNSRLTGDLREMTGHLS